MSDLRTSLHPLIPMSTVHFPAFLPSLIKWDFHFYLMDYQLYAKVVFNQQLLRLKGAFPWHAHAHTQTNS